MTSIPSQVGTPVDMLRNCPAVPCQQCLSVMYAFCANVLCDDIWHHLAGGHSHPHLAGGLGTFQYMAPEVMANQRYSVKADVYSFGMVLWECTARQVCSHSPCLAELKADVYSFGMVSWECTARQVRPTPPSLSMDGSVPNNHAAADTERQGAQHSAENDMQAHCWLRKRCCAGAIRRTERDPGCAGGDATEAASTP